MYRNHDGSFAERMVGNDTSGRGDRALDRGLDDGVDGGEQGELAGFGEWEDPVGDGGWEAGRRGMDDGEHGHVGGHRAGDRGNDSASEVGDADGFGPSNEDQEEDLGSWYRTP